MTYLESVRKYDNPTMHHPVLFTPIDETCDFYDYLALLQTTDQFIENQLIPSQSDSEADHATH